jgi:hypothetical protein
MTGESIGQTHRAERCRPRDNPLGHTCSMEKSPLSALDEVSL